MADYQLVDVRHHHDDSIVTRMLGKRWTLTILHQIGEKKVARFNQIKRTITSISATMLAERLSELQAAGLVTKIVTKVYNEIPPRVKYSLTESAIELELILGELDEWHLKWNGPSCWENGAQYR